MSSLSKFMEIRPSSSAARSLASSLCAIVGSILASTYSLHCSCVVLMYFSMAGNACSKLAFNSSSSATLGKSLHATSSLDHGLESLSCNCLAHIAPPACLGMLACTGGSLLWESNCFLTDTSSLVNSPYSPTTCFST